MSEPEKSIEKNERELFRAYGIILAHHLVIKNLLPSVPEALKIVLAELESADNPASGSFSFLASQDSDTRETFLQALKDLTEEE